MERLQQVQGALVPEQVKVLEGERLKITDNRTGKTIEVTLKESKDCYFVNSKDIGKLVDKDEEPLRLYDPGYMETICNTSRISYIDGDKGVLEYRGIPIEQLAEKSTFLEVAFLLIYGELPSSGQLNNFS
jgi:citrate synthase